MTTGTPAEILRVTANDGTVHLAHALYAIMSAKPFPACKRWGSSPINATYAAADSEAELTCAECTQRQAHRERRAAARAR